MIYPEFFPEDRENEIAEKKVFEQLKRISDTMIFFILENLLQTV